MLKVLKILVLAACGTVTSATDDITARVEAAMASPTRPAADRAIDGARKPLQVLQFSGVVQGMTVLDVTAGGGYYTELLSAAVGPDGTVIAQNPAGIAKIRGGVVKQAYDRRVADNRLANVESVVGGLAGMALDGVADMVFWSLNFHDSYNLRGPQAAADQLRIMKRALKPGGLLVIIDHAGTVGADNKSLHRIEQSIAENSITQAGFTLEAVSSLLANPADDHSLNVFDPAIRRHTDRFIIRARNVTSD